MVWDFLKDDKIFPIYSLSAVKPKIKYVTGSSLFSLLIKLFRIYEQQIFCQTERGYFCLFFSFLNAIFFHMLIFPVVMFVYFTLIMGGIRCFSSRRRTWNFKDLRGINVTGHYISCFVYGFRSDTDEVSFSGDFNDDTHRILKP